MDKDYLKIRIGRKTDNGYIIESINGGIIGEVLTIDGITCFYPDWEYIENLPIDLATMADIVGFMTKFNFTNCFQKG